MTDADERARVEAIGRDRARRIREVLNEVLHAERVEVVDDSWKHRGHEGAKDGRGHFRVVVVSPDFDGKTTLARHRMVYDALSDLIITDIHALTIQALGPAEGAPKA